MRLAATIPAFSPRLAACLVLAALLASCDDGDTAARGSAADGAAERAHVLALDAGRPRTVGLDSALLDGAVARAAELPGFRCLLIARHGETLAERCAPGFAPDGYANVKSVSKSVLSALVGIAIADGHLEGVHQPIGPLLEPRLDAPLDAARASITIGQLLSMRSGLERTSGRNYGGWVRSRNWVRDALRRPLVAAPGQRMQYSTGNYHLLSAVLTEATGRSTLAFARDRLAAPLGITIPAWPRDPQGIYFGGNDMRLTPRALLRFGELYRQGGMLDGRQIVPAWWVRASLEPRTRSPWSGDGYGYGWFLADAGGYPMFYARGYGAQFIFVVPDLELTVVTTTDPNVPRGSGPTGEIRRLLAERIVPAAVHGAAMPAARAGTSAAAARATRG